MLTRTPTLFAAFCVLLPAVAAQCQISGVVSWLVPLSVQVMDTDRGDIFRGVTTNVNAIQSSQHSGDALNNGPYFTATLEDSEFVLSLSEAFEEYEEHEYSQSMNIQIVFGCTGGTTSTLIVLVNVQDTNNHAPRFLPTDVYTFDIIPPIVPGYELTNCYGDIVARDVDLTTQSIVFSIEDNPYFEIDYGGRDPADSKNFFAVLRSTAIIRSLPEPLEFTITAEDVDLTGDPRQSSVATIRIEANDEFALPAEPVFSLPFYTATYNADHTLDVQTITLAQGYDEQVVFTLSGDLYAEYFSLLSEGNSVSLQVVEPLPANILEDNMNIILVVHATRDYTSGDTSTIIVELPQAPILQFGQISYEGVITDGVLELSPLDLIETGSAEVTANVVGDYATYFTAQVIGATIIITVNSLPEDILQQNSFISLVVQASSGSSTASAALVLDIIADDAFTPVFAQDVYSSSYDSDIDVQISDITLAQGYDDTVQFSIDGDGSQYFAIQPSGNSASIALVSSLPPEVIANQNQLLFTVRATKPRTVGASAAVSILLPSGTDSGVFFDQALYTGDLVLGVTSHEPILVFGYTGTEIQLSGEYASQFSGAADDEGRVEVRAAEGAAVPPDATHVALQLQAGAARAVLVLAVAHPDSPGPPTVSFESESYVMRTDVAQTGMLGRVSAAADNGETLIYSLLIDNVHLEERLSVSTNGELWLSAPLNSGVFLFTARATTVATQIAAEATVHLTVDSVVICGTDDRILQPLIVLERDEEEPHEDLVILNEEHAADCSYDFNYRWPSDRDWLYINERGHLSARAIDREDPAIAFMALSQVQVELILTCSNDNTLSRQYRNTNRTRRDLGPYDYGTNRWILAEGISYNARRSFVNIIVNDINDNPPIFVDKENEPIVVGYPVPEILDAVAPSALVTLQATDADIGVNAELVYWSSAPQLAVSARSGAVHVRDNAARALQSGDIFTVSASDLGGEPGGHTGDIQLMVRLLERNNIAVLTVRNALSENEEEIIEQLIEALQYEIKSLRATVISDEYDVEEQSTRSRGQGERFYDDGSIEGKRTMNGDIVKRSKRQTEVSEAGASLRVFIYGIINTQPVEAVQLISDIENSEVAVEWMANFEVQDLDQHLEEISRVITVPDGYGSGLLVSTIVLSVLLVTLIVFLVVWYFVKMRKTNNYENFSDVSSRKSDRIFDTLPKVDDPGRPRPNIAEIKRTERRLKEMLEQPVLAPIEETVQPHPETSTNNNIIPEVPQQENKVKFETISEVTQPDKNLPIVIQSIDKLKADEDTEDEDEFGERLHSRKKSVVTFNEQVEKIIHVDSIADDPEDNEVQVYRL